MANILNIINSKLGSKILIKIIKWIILVCSYSYIAYLLITYDKYAELAYQLSNTSYQQTLWFVIALLLVPLNLFIESSKWKYLISKSQILTIKESFKSVLLGFSTGFITPYRVGDMVGRMTYLNPENRKQAITYSLINSYTLNLVLACFGLPASIILCINIKKEIMTSGELSIYFGLILLGVLLSFIAYFIAPKILQKIKNKTVKSFCKGLEKYSTTNLLYILLFSLARYFVFCFQFYAVLKFFSIDIEVWQALLAIPANYLFITFTPSLAISETAIRSSYAMLFIGFFSNQLISIALAGTLIWIINFGLPMMAGSYILAKKKI